MQMGSPYQLGENNEMLLTHTERVELENYILYYWKLDPKTGVPYNQKQQPDQADVRLSICEAKKNPILKSRPMRALRRAAQRRVSDLNNMLEKSLNDNQGDKPQLTTKRGSKRQLNSKEQPKKKKKKITEYEPGLEMLRLKARGFVLGKTAALPISSERLSTETASEPGPSKPLNVPASSSKRKATTPPENPNKKKRKTDKHKKGSVESSGFKASGNSVKAGKDSVVDESDDSDSDDDGPDVESPLKRPRQPSAKVVQNEELASQNAAEKEKKLKGEPKISKKAKAEEQRIAARALQEQAVAETLRALGASGQPSYVSPAVPSASEPAALNLDSLSVKPFGFPDDGLSSVTINSRNLHSLEDGAQLMDDIVDFYFKFLKLVELSADAQEQVYFFNAFFYKKLLAVELEKAGCKRPNLEEFYKPVFAWVKSEDIFTKDSLLFPIVDSNHWSFVLALNPGAFVRTDTSQKPCFLHFNSIPGTHEKAVESIRLFISELYLFKNPSVLRPAKRTAPLKPFAKAGMPCIEMKVPEQDNDVDCGLYTMEYAEQYLKHMPSEVDTKKKTMPVEQLLPVDKSIFEPAQVTKKREFVRRLILTIGQQLESGALTRPFAPAALRRLAVQAQES